MPFRCPESARTLLLGLCLSLATAGPLVADEAAAGARRVLLPGETKQYLSRLKFADNLAAQQKWPEAIDEYQGLLHAAGDALVPADTHNEELTASRRSVQLRRLCHQRLAGLPAPALKLYRGRVDLQAKRWLQQGVNQRDADPLRRIVDEAFCSRFGDQALELLGDLTFERGQFAQARAWWRLLAVPASEADRERPPGELIFPDPQVDVAGVRARQILAYLFEGDQASAMLELKAFQARHAEAKGHLAGRDGNYAAILQDWLRQPPISWEQEQWPTFAGAPSRSRALPEAPPRRLWADGPTWRVRLATGKKIDPADESDGPLVVHRFLGVLPTTALARRLAFHPLVYDDQVLVADTSDVSAYDLHSGDLVFRYDFKEDGAKAPPPNVLEPGDLRCTLSAEDGRLYARMGPTSRSFLVCLDLKPAEAQGKRERWRVTTEGLLEVAPLADAGRVFVALSRVAGGRVQTAITCYDGDTGALRWKQEVCDVPESQEKGGQRQLLLRLRRQVLTLAGTQIVYCSHAGTITALDALTGKHSWGVRYPSRGATTAEGDPSPRELGACLYADYRLFVAPQDSDRLLCLDPTTGRTLWERDRIEVVHLLGCSQSRLVFTTPLGIRAVGTRSGGDEDGWAQPTEGRLPGFGRGLLAGGWVFWPTQDPQLPLRALNVEDGSQQKGQQSFEPTQLRQIVPGNMAFGGGCLVVAGTEELVGYVPPEHFLQKRQAEAAAPAVRPAAWYRLARAEVGAGLATQALEHLARAEKDATLRRLARQRRHELLLELAERGKPEEYLTRAAAAEFPSAARLRALERLAVHRESADPRLALQTWQTILRDRALRLGTLSATASGDYPREAGRHAAARIQELIRQHGRALYADTEAEAGRLAQTQDTAEGLQRVIEEFPNSQAALTALLRLIELHEKAGRPGAAAHARRLFLRYAHRDLHNDAEVANLLVGLALDYEREKCWEAARPTWQFLAAHHADRRIKALDRFYTVGETLAVKLQDPVYRALAGNGPVPARVDLELPLVRAWESLAGRLLRPAQTTLSPAAVEVVFAGRGRELTCLDARTGSPRWLRPLPSAPTWVGTYGDTVIAAGPEGLQVVRLEDGGFVWGWSLTAEAPDPEETLSDFRLTPSRLFCLQGRRRLLALDPKTGQVHWSHWAPSAQLRPLGGGRFQPSYHAGAEHVVLQSTGGQRLILNARTGVQTHAAVSPIPWPQPPLVLEEGRVCLVENGQAVLLDAAAGKEIWRYRPRLPTTLTGEPPRLFGDRDGLLILLPRNYGYDLERLDPRTGENLWAEAARVYRSPFSAEAVVHDDQAVYCISDNVLHARGLDDGRPLWQRRLSDEAASWRLLCTNPYLIACPLQPEMQLRWRWLPAADGMVAVPVRGRFGRTFSVLLHEPQTGRLVEKLNLAAPVPDPDVQLFPNRLVVTAAGKVWGLQSLRSEPRP